MCTQFELLGPDREFWLEDDRIDLNMKAQCLMYVHCYGGCRVKDMSQVRNSTVGMLVLELIKARRVAVLLSFHAAGKARVGSPLIAAAHAAMQMVPKDLLQEIICAAGLQILE